MSTQTSNNPAPRVSFSSMMPSAVSLCAKAYNDIMSTGIRLQAIASDMMSKLYAVIHAATMVSGQAALTAATSMGNQSISSGVGQLTGGGLSLASVGTGALATRGIDKQIKANQEQQSNVTSWKSEIANQKNLVAGQPNEQARVLIGGGAEAAAGGAHEVSAPWARDVESGSLFAERSLGGAKKDEQLSAAQAQDRLAEDKRNLSTYQYGPKNLDTLDEAASAKKTELEKQEKRLNQTRSAIESKHQNFGQIANTLASGSGQTAAGHIAVANAQAEQNKVVAESTRQLTESGLSTQDGMRQKGDQTVQSGSDIDRRTADNSSR